MAQSTGTLAAIAGCVCLAIAMAIVGGIVVSVVNKGEDHKEKMMASPPPPPARRELFDQNLFQPPKDAGFNLNVGEKAKLDAGHRRPVLHKR